MAKLNLFPRLLRLYNRELFFEHKSQKKLPGGNYFREAVFLTQSSSLENVPLSHQAPHPIDRAAFQAKKGFQ